MSVRRLRLARGVDAARDAKRSGTKVLMKCMLALDGTWSLELPIEEVSEVLVLGQLSTFVRRGNWPSYVSTRGKHEFRACWPQSRYYRLCYRVYYRERDL